MVTFPHTLDQVETLGTFTTTTLFSRYMKSQKISTLLITQLILSRTTLITMMILVCLRHTPPPTNGSITMTQMATFASLLWTKMMMETLSVTM